MSSEECGFDGNPDLYGVGIRIGYYTQALAAWFANWFVLSEARGLRKTNTLFLFAAMLALIVYVAHPGEVYAIEAYAPLQIGVVLGTVTAARQTSRTVGYNTLSVIQLSVFLLLQLSAHGFSLWFWSTGVTLMQRTPCGTYFFLFAKLSLYGAGRWVMLALSTLSTALNVLAVIPWNVSILLRTYGLRHIRPHFEHWALERIQKQAVKPTDDGKAADKAVSVSRPAPAGFDLDLLYNAESYLDTLFAPVSKSGDHQPIVQRLPPIRKAWTSAGFRHYLQGSWQLFKVNTFDWGSTKPRVMLATQFKDLPLPRPTWGDVIGRMVAERRRGRPPPHWHVLGLASEIQLSQTPPKTQVSWKRQASVEFLFIAFIVVQLETTLVWNSIRGISVLKSIGQLIPLIMGVGGLATVLWIRRGVVPLLWKPARWKKLMKLAPPMEPPDAFLDAVAVYKEWKAGKVP